MRTNTKAQKTYRFSVLYTLALAIATCTLVWLPQLPPKELLGSLAALGLHGLHRYAKDLYVDRAPTGARRYAAIALLAAAWTAAAAGWLFLNR